jgi:hypothetical protein
MDKIISNEITDSIRDVTRKRLTSPVYGTFLISWLVFHWEFVFTALFVSEEKIWQVSGLLKNDYLVKTFFDLGNWYFYVSWILPFVFTWLIIWKFPKWISLPAFKKDEEYRLEKNRIRIIEQKKLEIKELEPRIGWRIEYNSFKNSQYYHDFNLIIESVYEGSGKITWAGRRGLTNLPKGILAYAHTNGLIDLDGDKKSINLTEKGKFFVKRFSLDNKI